MKNKITKISFGESVKRLSYDEFMARFLPIYPDADLQAYAKELGLAIVREKPRGGRRKTAAVKKSHDQDIANTESNPQDKRTGTGPGEHEAYQAGLH